MNKAWSCLAAGLTLMACATGAEMTVTVESAQDVRFEVKPPDDHFCLLIASIVREGDKEPVWEIRRQNDGQAPCPTRFQFPEAPQGYALTRKARRLVPGRYQASADGGSAGASADFTVD